jgi:septal ring-binding cell division protein DamX
VHCDLREAWGWGRQTVSYVMMMMMIIIIIIIIITISLLYKSTGTLKIKKENDIEKHIINNNIQNI